MSQESNAELVRRIAALEAENRALRSVATSGSEEVVGGETTAIPRSRAWPWNLLASTLIVIGVVLAPVAVVAAWAKIELTDTDRFVAAYAPIADDPAVQKFVTDQTVDVINQQVDIPQLTSDVIDGITALGTGPVATNALDAMKGPAAAGVQSLMSNAVGNFVESDAFSAVWQEALRISHGQFVAAMQNDPESALQLKGDGSIGVQLAPVIAAAKTQLLANGLSFASQIPEIDRTIVIAQSDAVPTAQLGYNVAVAAGSWLPWVSLALIVAGVLVARRKPVALIWAAVGLALSMAITLAGFAIGNLFFISAMSPSVLPNDVAALLYETVIGIMQTLSVAILVLAVVIAVVAWFAGPFRTPTRLRGFFGDGARWVRESGDRRHISTGKVGEWLYRQRVLVRVVLAIAAAAVIILVRPLTAGLILWTLVVAILVLVALELVQRPTAESADVVLDAEPGTADVELSDVERELVDVASHSTSADAPAVATKGTE